MGRITAVVVLSIVLVSASSIATAASREPAAVHKGNRGARLGQVDFRTSCSPQIQATMNTAVALLHSFQYQQAEAAFTAASKLDSRCGMAYWGRAMSVYHQLWDFPDAQTLAQGRAHALEAEKLPAKTKVERDYIAAIAAFYLDHPALSHAARVWGYARAMKKVYADSPKDPNAAAFYALALVNLAGYENDMANRKKAIAILEPVFKAYPDNPGLAHYLIHATDTPTLAPLGLAAARRYAKIAPDSAHALHMPSHIFTRLGLWQESIGSNLASAAAAKKATEAHESDASYQVHAMNFLDYAYLQSGQEAKARQIVAELKDVPGAAPDDIVDEQGYLAARNAVELQRWKEAAGLPVAKLPNWRLDSTYFARALGSARIGDVAAARIDLSKLNEAVIAQRKHFESRFNFLQEPSIEEEEAHAWVEFAEGKRQEALKTLRATASREHTAGVDSLTRPAREMLGDMLLESKEPKKALEAYRAALKESPNRFDAVWGAAQAARATADASAAREYCSKLLEISGPGADRPELKEARAYVAGK